LDNKELVKVAKEELEKPSDHNQVNVPNNLIFKKLIEEITDHVKIVSEKLGYKEETSVTCIESWININHAKEITKPHLHAKAEIAAVYYALADEVSAIEFLNPLQQLQYIIDNKKIKNWNEYNSFTWKIVPTSGKLLIFPGWLLHYVINDKNINERISIAFNYRII
tara:strand:+ start:298 stop:795 length:498 start_codon:yes stop_codon:yes gene_type:complete